jgi:hypothetical protein
LAANFKALRSDGREEVGTYCTISRANDQINTEAGLATICEHGEISSARSDAALKRQQNIQRATMPGKPYGNEISRIANLALSSFFDIMSMTSFNMPDGLAMPTPAI